MRAYIRECEATEDRVEEGDSQEKKDAHREGMLKPSLQTSAQRLEGVRHRCGTGGGSPHERVRLGIVVCSETVSFKTSRAAEQPAKDARL